MAAGNLAAPLPVSPRPDTYAASCSEAPAGWLRPGYGEFPNHFALVNMIGMTAGGDLIWNRGQVPRDRLLQYLRITATIEPQPMTLLRVDPDAPCGAVRALRREMENVLRCSEGRCGEGDASAFNGEFVAPPRQEAERIEAHPVGNLQH